MKIKQINFSDQILDFANGGYVMSHTVQTQLNIRILRLETWDGHIGWGEIIRKGWLNEQAMPLEEAILASLTGKPLTAIPALLAELQQGDVALRGLAFGLDTAFHDWTARKAGFPLYSLLGGKINEKIPDYYSLSGDTDPENTEAKLRSETRDWAVVQLKLGVTDRETDKALIRASMNALSAEQTILADFNGALGVDDALDVVGAFNDSRIIWEEPCPTIEENNAVAARSGQAVMFDQCLTDLASVIKAIAAKRAHSLVIKPPFLGGLAIARVARDLCIAAGMPMRIDGPWCGHIATAANLHLACGVPSDLLIAGGDLRQPLILEEDWGGTRHLPEHHIVPFDEPGHGVEVSGLRFGG